MARSAACQDDGQQQILLVAWVSGSQRTHNLKLQESQGQTQERGNQEQPNGRSKVGQRMMSHGYGSIVAMLEACNLVNINTIQHGEAPATHKEGSHHIDFMFISGSLVRNVKGCRILPFDSIFSSNHMPLYVDFDVTTIFGHPSIGTEKEALHNLQLDNPRLIAQTSPNKTVLLKQTLTGSHL
jgi:hypothetical protein